MKNTSNIIWGFILIAVGILVGLKSLNILNFNIFFNGWWTLFIIVPCFVSLFTDKDKTGSVIGFVVGVGLLLAAQNFISFGLLLKLLFPVILVIIGLSMVFKDSLTNSVKKEIKKFNKNVDGKEYCATFSGQNLEFANEEFKGCDLTAIFGGIKCDLREAKIEEDVVINCSSIFGGIDIYVPKDVRVKVSSNSIFGGISSRKNKNVVSNAKTIYINGTCLFGGVEVK